MVRSAILSLFYDGHHHDDDDDDEESRAGFSYDAHAISGRHITLFA